MTVLEHYRATQDVDILIEFQGSIAEYRNNLWNLLTEADARFSARGLKLFFSSSEGPEEPVCIETLPAGELGLPRRLNFVQLRATHVSLQADSF